MHDGEVIMIRGRKLQRKVDDVANQPITEFPVVFADWIDGQLLIGHALRHRMFPVCRTFWLFLSQVFSADGSCAETVRKACGYLGIVQGCDKLPAASTSAYCQARGRLPQDTINSVSKSVTDKLMQDPDTDWYDRKVRVVDGSTCSMPDTPLLQEKYPQPAGQKAGCGFPVMRIVGLFSLSTGVLIAEKHGPLAQSEHALWRDLWSYLCKGDIVLSDRGLCSFAEFYLLLEQEVDSVARLHAKRSAGVRLVKCLGPGDELVEWVRSKSVPEWLTAEQWQAMPQTLTVRHITFRVTQPGFRSETITVATTLLDDKRYSKKAISDLYLMRWQIELFLRDIKTTMGMDVLRCKSPEMIEKELAMHLLAYNLIRGLMLEAARTHDTDLFTISFKQSLQTVRQWEPLLTAATLHERHKHALDLLLRYIAGSVKADRPGRSEPRARKRRPKNYQLMTEPRGVFKSISHRNRYKAPATK